MMTSSEIIIKRIKDLCDERKITINKLATLSGITQSTLSNIIHATNKNPRVDTLCKIANGFGMTLSEFFDFHEMNNIVID